MATPVCPVPVGGAKELDAKVDRTALIAHMSAALKTASDRWSEVCRIYDLAWKDAYGTYDGVLAKINEVKKEREQRAADRLKLCLELACVFLPVIGGKAAISLAPIVSARGKLLANFVEREAQAAWSQYAAANPLVSKVVKEIGTRSVNQGKEAAAKIQKEVMEKLTPKYTKEKALASNTTPLDEFINNTNETRGVLNKWVENCAEWNARGRWERELVPVAYESFLQHPWIRTAPAEDVTQKMRGELAVFVEIALWLRWARNRQEGYWRKIHDWYHTEYLRLQTQDGKREAAISRRNWVIDALDYRFLLIHMQWNFPRGMRHSFGKMTLKDPESRWAAAEDSTVDLYDMIRQAKDAKLCRRLLSDVLPMHLRYDYGWRETVTKALQEM